MSGRRSEVCPRGEHLEHIFAPLGHELNLSRGTVANPSFKPETLGLVSGSEAKAHPLDSPAHHHAKLPQGGRHSLTLAQQLQQASFVQDADAQILCFLELRARFLPGNHEVCLSTD